MRGSGLPLRRIFTGKSKSYFRVTQEMTRQRGAIFRRFRLMNGNPGRVFARKVRRKNCMQEDRPSKGMILLLVQSMRVEQWDGKDPHDHPRQDQNA